MSFISLQPRLASRDFSTAIGSYSELTVPAPSASEDLSQIVLAAVSQEQDPPVGCERPGLVGVFPTGVAEKHIPVCTYLSAPLVFNCS